MYTQLLHLIHILLLLVNNVVGVHAVRMVDSLYCQCSAYDLVLILDDNKVFVFVFVFDRSANWRVKNSIVLEAIKYLYSYSCSTRE